MPTHTLCVQRVKARTVEKKRRSIRHPQQSYSASLGPQMTDSCTSIHTLTVQKDNSVIICGPDLEPNNADLVVSFTNPLVKTIKWQFLLESELSHRLRETKKKKERHSKYVRKNEVVQFTTSKCFHVSIFQILE